MKNKMNNNLFNLFQIVSPQFLEEYIEIQVPGDKPIIITRREALAAIGLDTPKKIFSAIESNAAKIQNKKSKNFWNL